MYSKCFLWRWVSAFSRYQNFENRFGRIFLRSIRSWKKSKKSGNRKIEKSDLISIENFRIFWFSDFRFSKIFNWNQVTFFDFSIFRFFESDRSLTGHSSELRLYFLIILGALKRWDSCAFNASKIMQNKIPTAKRQHQTWAKKNC